MAKEGAELLYISTSVMARLRIETVRAGMGVRKGRRWEKTEAETGG